MIGRRVAAAVASCLLFSFGAAGAETVLPGGTFIDDDNNLHEANIEAIAFEGITRGCNPPVNDHYCPDATVTRAQMAAFLVRALGLEEDGGGNTFIDDDDSIFEADIAKLAAAGITKGCNPPENTKYCPDAPVTRGQMAAFLVRAMGYTDTGVGNLFVDDDGSVFEVDIDKLGTVGVTKGCNPPLNDQFCPDDPVRRDQMASFLTRALDLTPIQPPPRPPDMTGFVYVDYRELRSEDDPGTFVSAVGYDDFNLDGIADVFVAPGVWSWDPTPVEMYLGDDSGGFSLDNGIFNGLAPVVMLARKAVVDDYNDDGYPDVFIADSGVDRPPFPGGVPLLLLSDGAGKLDAIAFRDLVAFHHGIASGDVDEDGDIDVVLTGNINVFYRALLVNDGTGAFEAAFDRIPQNVHWEFTTELVDVDGDTHLDLLMAGHEYNTASTVYWGDGSGYFTEVQKTVLPEVDGLGVVVDIDVADLDDDGRRDVVLTRTGSPPSFYVGYHIQIIRQTSERRFVDETASRIPEGSSATDEWIVWLRPIDTNHDGHIDLLVDDKARNIRWLNDGTGHFTKATAW